MFGLGVIELVILLVLSLVVIGTVGAVIVLTTNRRQ
jgi:Tfp pilus assembly protein PilW